MPVSGLVITLSRDDADADRALRALRAHPSFDLGEPCGPRLPVVLDTADGEEDKRLWAWLNALPGVAFVDLVFVRFEDALEATEHDADPAAGAAAPDQAFPSACVKDGWQCR